MPLQKTPTGVILAIRLTPNAATSGIGPIEDGPYGPRLKCRVTTYPEDGKANKTLLKFVAKSLGRPVSTITVASGVTNRNKQLHITGDPDLLYQQVHAWLNAVHESKIKG
ncbi:MAG: hypothetical protein CMF31_01930 [Kordiimonas sp.]|nr:hypothetical protein [Kordiimonas sp.]|tara:strand:+ start:1152 stop:1481 length:330 start_codon:yes stop_codon:yes gene_type:complete